MRCRYVACCSIADRPVIRDHRQLREAGFKSANLSDEEATDVHADTRRHEAIVAVAALKAMSIRTVLLTGDGNRVAKAVGKEFDVDEVIAELLPEQKSEYVGGLVDACNVVAKVGGGVNDAPALARESAAIVSLGNDLTRFVETVQIARGTKAIVIQNFVETIVVDTLGILLAASGLLNLLFAAFNDVTSELTSMLNSTRMPAAHKTPQMWRKRQDWAAAR